MPVILLPTFVLCMLTLTLYYVGIPCCNFMLELPSFPQMFDFIAFTGKELLVPLTSSVSFPQELPFPLFPHPHT